MDILRTPQIRELAKSTANHCVSVYMRTHASGADGEQDPARLRDLVKQAEQLLIDGGVRAPEARDFLESVRAINADPIFWEGRSAGLALFLSDNDLRYFRVPLELVDMVKLNRRFHIKPLIPLLSDQQFFLLALSQNSVRLLSGTQHEIDELRIDGVATNLAEALNYDQVARGAQAHTAMRDVAGKQGAVFHGQGGQKESTKEEVTQFFRLINARVSEILRDEDAPLILAGVASNLAIYRELNSYHNLIEESVEGNFDRATPHELLQKSWPSMQKHFAKLQQAALNRLREATGSPKSSQDPAEIVRAAHEGKIDTLLVDTSTEQWGSFDSDTFRTEIHFKPKAGDEDLVDLAAAQTLLNRGSVFAVDGDQLPAETTMAAIFRY